jgi:hypothetical protein
VTPEQLKAALTPALTAAGYKVEDLALAGGWALGARRRDFRVRWIFTQLKTTVVVTYAPVATLAVLQQFAQESFRDAAAVKGGLPNGLQSGVGCVAVLVTERVEPDAADFARQKPTREWFTGISTLAVVTPTEVLTYDGKVAVGGVYVPFLRAQRALVISAVRAAST